MTGVVKTDYSPKKGKENKNLSNHIPVPTTLRKNAKNEAKSPPTPKKEKADESSRIPITEKIPKEKKFDKVDATQDGGKEEEDNSSGSTSNRSVRPQTKILRRPTPNLKHPVIQVDSDDSGGDSCSSDKSKDDNPKRLKMGSEVQDSSSLKRKNFIMYNKNNVDKNTKNATKERTSATLTAAIPNPCNSCNRSQAPERLHSHARKDARGLMLRRTPPAADAKVASPAMDSKTPSPAMDVKIPSPVVIAKMSSPAAAALDVKMTSPTMATKLSATLDVKMTSPTLDVKMASPQKKSINKLSRDRRKIKDVKHSSLVERTKDGLLTPISRDTTTEVDTENEDSLGDICVNSDEPQTPSEDFLEPLKACYICQKEFKISLLLLHESKCLETWKKTNNSLNPNLRQLPPRRTQEQSAVDEAGDPAWSSVQSQLVPCPLCSRTFFPERLPVHRRVCKGKQSPRPLKRASSLREQSASSTDGEDSKATPLYLPCYVCHRNYGSWVLPMHEQQCLKKWRKENDELADEDKQEEPTKNPDYDDDVASLIELGDTAWESHLQQLVPCPRCCRTFFPDRLEIHQRSCKGPASNRRPRSNKGI